MNRVAFDVVVVGTGPGGEGAAMQATKLGRKVAVVERYLEVGGSCTHLGTIPTKALRFAIAQMTELNRNRMYRQLAGTGNMAFADLRRGAEAIVRQQVDMRSGFYERNRVTMIGGQGRFLDPHTMETVAPDGAKQRISAEAFIIACGSRPYRPPDVDFSHPRVFDSDTIMSLDYSPQSITVYGAGVIGCEWASMFRNLGWKVNLVNTRTKLLEFLDDEIIDALSYHLRDCGVLIRHQETYSRVEGRDDGVVLHLQSGKQLKTDVLLWANGRTGNSDTLEVDRLGIEPDSRGNLLVNENFQTSVPHVYAVGDVIGFPALASAAYMQGRAAAIHVVHGQCDRMGYDIPTGIYTSPEISSLGKTERELTAENVPYEVGHAQFKSLARGQITGQTVGVLKLLFHRETLAILGIHCFGANASEIIHIGQAIMCQQGAANSLLYFINTTFNYPTMAEAYRVAALNGYNRLS